MSSAPIPTVIVNIIIDDLGNGNVGWHTPNPPENLTPRLHELAREGIILERQYNHFTCTPSRSAFTTGRLPVHVQLTLDNPDSIASGIPVNMTALPLKLTKAGFMTATVGKYDQGWASFEHHLPLARGYQRSLVYAEHMNNYFTKRIEPTGTNCANTSIYDLWEDNHPATTLVGNNSEYIDSIFHNRALQYIQNFTLERGAGGPQHLYLDYRESLKSHLLTSPLRVLL